MDEQERVPVARIILWYVMWFIILAAIVWLIVWAVFFRGKPAHKTTPPPKKPSHSQTAKPPTSPSPQNQGSNSGTVPPPSGSGASQNQTGQSNQQPGAPSTLTNTGPGDVVAIFVVTTAAGAFAYRAYLRRQLR